ncbi:hypothetical protein [Oceanibaculum indicum]|uniref:Uncharacterized protein n=1 Tax=Oceanibaculum indicum TaxID=526216 RepID=A0A420WGK9_9PROT|nr:hypothetical protein [Oceanibaculum indicum]RKQ70117.1 hypothetical protein BCL74_2057 [Oceanibaculum indicum]
MTDKSNETAMAVAPAATGPGEQKDKPKPPASAQRVPKYDEAVRVAAAGLREAVIAARAAGYVIDMPFRVEHLDRISISETAAVSGPRPKAATKPAA